MLAWRAWRALAFVSPLLMAACQQPQPSPTPAPPAPPAAPAVSPAVSPSPAAKPSPSPAASPAASPSASPVGLPPEVVVTANRDDRSLSIVDPVSARVISTVALDRPVRGVTISPDQRTAFATDPSEGSRSVVLADLAQAREVGDVTVGSRPDGIAAAASSGEVVVANGGDNSVSFFDPQTRAPSAAVPVGATPRGVALAAVDGRPTAFVANAGDGTMSVIDIAQHRVLASVSVGGQPIGVAPSIDGARVYALDAEGGNVAVVDARANQVIRTVHVGDGLTGLDTTADGRFLLITSSDATRNLYKLDVATDQVGNPLNIGSGTLAVAASPRAERAYITTADNRLVIWDTSGDRTVSTVNVGQRPEGVAAHVQPAAAPAASPGASPAASPPAGPATAPAGTVPAAPAASPAPAVSPVPSPKP